MLHKTVQCNWFSIEYYRHDLIAFVNDMLWTFDPRVSPSFLPFDLFPKQEEYLRWRQQRRLLKQNGLTAKSRDMGVTYLNCAHQLHCWLFEEGFAGGFGSRKQDLVDRIGDTSSIFEKLRFMLRQREAIAWQDLMLRAVANLKMFSLLASAA